MKLIKLNLYTNLKDKIIDDFYDDGIISGNSTNAVFLFLLLLLVVYNYMNVI